MRRDDGLDRAQRAGATDVCRLVRLYLLGRPLVWPALNVAGYAALVGLLTWGLIVTPVQALVSNTGYARVASQSAMNALSVAQRSLMVSTIGNAVASGSMSSVAARLVTAAAGWPALGVAAGLLLIQAYYSATDVQQLFNASGTSTISITNYTNPPNMTGGACGGANASICGNSAMSRFYIQVPGANPSAGCVAPVGATVPAGWAGWMNVNANGSGALLPGCYAFKPDSATSTVPSIAVTPPTSQDVQDYLNSLPASDPLSVASHTQTVGVGKTAPDADTQTTVAVDPAQVPTTVVPSSTVTTTDTVLNPNEPVPTKTTEQTQDTQKTTTTTTNPDGSTTTTETDTASVSCDMSEHDQRTFGRILESHMTTWAGSGIAGQLNLLKTLTWPSTLPVLSLSSSLFGNFTVDFNTWATQFAVLRSLIIAAAGLVAYRIVFVGGAGGSAS